MGEDGRKDTTFANEVERLIEDFESRTLDGMGGRFRRLIHLASLRDYNTGRYHHAGLEARYWPEAVNEGLRQCHIRVFQELVTLPLKVQTEDLLDFFESLREERSRLVDAWQRLRSYQVLPPENCNPLARELFDKNCEIILGVLRQTEFWELLHDPHSHPDDLA